LGANQKQSKKMALTYTDFQTYPTDIAGIDSTYNAKIAAIEAFIVEDMQYDGDAVDVGAILKYFAYWYLCHDQISTVTAKTGENIQIQKSSIPSFIKQVQAWDLGVEKLTDICDEHGTTANVKYLRGINIFL
jgi:hypothetical protein